MTQSPIHNSHFSGTNFFKKALESRGNKTNTQKTYRTLGSPEVHRVVLVCSLYHTALNTLTQMQLDILTGKNIRTVTEFLVIHNMNNVHCCLINEI